MGPREEACDRAWLQQFDDHNEFVEKVDVTVKKWGEKLSAGDRKTLLRTVSWTADASKVIKKV